MAVTIKRYGVDISSSIDVKSVNLKTVLTDEVSQLKFRIKNTSSTSSRASATLGAVIDLYEDATHSFGGTVTEINNVVEGGILLASDFIVNDWSFRLNSKLVIQTYENMDPRDIVLDIISNFTDGSFTTTNVQTGGFNVSSIKFNYEQVTISIQKLAKQIGWEWYVDSNKDVHFFPPSAVTTAPYTINDTGGNLEWPTLNIDVSIINMKNSIYVIGGTYQKTLDASTTPDVYLTDGTKSVFTIAYPYTPATIVVTLAGVSQTIGTDQITDPGSVQVLYNEGERFVKFTSTPAAAQTVKVYGEAQIPILAHVQDDAAIATYGEIQDSIIDAQIKSIEEAQARGSAQLSLYGNPVYNIKFSTLKTGFLVGQTVNISSTLFGVNVLVIIKRITSKMYSPSQFRHEIECVGTDNVSFVDIMKLLLLQNNSNTIVDDSTILQVLLLISESIALSDTLLAPTTDSGPYLWSPSGNDLLWNLGTWG